MFRRELSLKELKKLYPDKLENNRAMDRLYELYDTLGSWTNVAEKLGISPSYLSDVVNGRQEISVRLAQKLGFVKKCEFVEEVK